MKLNQVILFIGIVFFGAEKINAAVIYTGDNLPSSDEGWIMPKPRDITGSMDTQTPGILHLYDTSSETGSHAYFYKDLTLAPGTSVMYAEWDVLAVNSSDWSSVFILDREDTTGYDVNIEIAGDKINILPLEHESVLSVFATTTDDFHTYRVELENTVFRLYQDGNLLMTDTTAASNNHEEARIYFGLGSSLGQSEYYLDEVRAGSGTIGASNVIPEPMPLTLLGLGLMSLGLMRRRPM